MSSQKKSSLAAPGQLVSAICYAALVWVVNYGRHNYVYDGFNSVVPYIIMAIFAAMAVVRLTGFILSVKAQNTVSKYDRTREELDAADSLEHGGRFEPEEKMYWRE